MSVIKFEMTREHLSLIKNLRPVTETEDVSIIPKFYGPSPYSFGGGENVYDDVYAIVFGKMPDDFDPMEAEGFIYKDEDIAYMDLLIKEIPLALDIVLYFAGQIVEPGLYKTKYHIRDWKKIN